jgi:hypothetical protein
MTPSGTGSRRAWKTFTAAIPAGFILLPLLITGCTSKGSSSLPSHTAIHPAPSGTTETASVASATLFPTVTATAAGTVLPSVPRPIYKIEAVLDTTVAAEAALPSMLLSVYEQAVFTNTTTDTLQEMVFQLEPSLQPELFRLQKVSCTRLAADAQPIPADGVLRLPLQPALAPGETVSVTLEFQRAVTQGKELINWTDFQIVLGNWYAFLPLYQPGKGWLVHAPGSVGEYLTFPYADFDVRFDVTGNTSYSIAAGAAPEEGSFPPHYLFRGRSFPVVLVQQAPIRTSAGSVEVLAYTRPGHEDQAAAVAKTAAQVLDIYSRTYGEYPHSRLTVLESDLSDGMEFDGLVLLNPNLFPYYTGDGKDYLTMITAHETAHQWWYGLVGNDQAMDPWLDEAFATYSELLFYDTFYPGNTDWWWYTRVNRYPSNQCVDLSIYDFSTFRSYVDAVYLRGATLLDTLRLRMGDPPFWSGMRDLQTAGREEVIHPEDVFRIFQSHSPEPLSDIWEEFLCHPPSP